MHAWIRNWLMVGLVFFCATLAFGEYYQYRDKDGVLRFTDDIASIPVDQRPDVTTHQSVVSETVAPAIGGEAAEQANRRPEEPEQPKPSTDQATNWAAKVANERAALDQTQAQLKELFATLQAEKSALEGKQPPENAPYRERAAYIVQVEALNARIVDYETQLDAFNQKVNEFNAQLAK